MTERYGDEGGQRPSGRGAVTERLARRDTEVREIDPTDEASRPDAGDDTVVSPAAQPDGDQAERESSGAFEPASPAEADRHSSIFDVDERTRREDLNRTGYEPPVAATDAPAPVADPPVERPPDGEAAATDVPTHADAPATDAPTSADVPAATDAPVAAAETAAAPAAAETPGSPLGSLDSADVRSRFLDIQAGFVDEPRQAVEEAGRFVDDLLRQVTDALQQQRAQLAGATDEASTEDLRLALRAHRQFVDRLLSLGR